MKVGHLLSLTLLVAGAAGNCTPSCSYACDNPTCDAVCGPSCRAPVCAHVCGTLPPSHPCASCAITHADPVCTIACPPDQCSADECPMCETVCEKPTYTFAQCESAEVDAICASRDPADNCTVLCEHTNCDWVCEAPVTGTEDCPLPVCELQCQQPACACVGDDCELLSHDTPSPFPTPEASTSSSAESASASGLSTGAIVAIIFFYIAFIALFSFLLTRK